MFTGRSTQLAILGEMAAQDKNTLTILYGRTGIGKTELVRHFCADKRCVLYSAPAASAKEQFAIMKTQFARQLYQLRGEQDQRVQMSLDYQSLFTSLEGVDVFVIEEFQNIVKSDKEFIEAVSALVKGQLHSGRIMVICTSSSISWIENSLVSAIGVNAYNITTFLKMKALAFVDIVRMFPAYSVADCMKLYAITGGIPGYMRYFSDRRTLKENICGLILAGGAPLHNEGENYIREELRETSLYNTILYCIAGGETKLNELHRHTGFGRDKISVYLKNLMEREIVEKVFSFDTIGNKHTRKGLYAIREGMVEFWFRFLYAHRSELVMMEPEAFYDSYIADELEDFTGEAFIKIAAEYIELLSSMNQLPIEIDRRGRWWGKNGNIDLIATDTEGHYLIAQCTKTAQDFTFAMFEDLLVNVSLAGIGRDYIYLFSKGTFDAELKGFAAQNTNVVLVEMNQL